MSAIQQALLGYGATPKVYATWNPSDKNANITLSNGNLTETIGAINGIVRSTIGKSSGKWYWEYTVNSSNCITGIATSSASLANGQYLGSDSGGYGYQASNGQKINNASQSAYGSTYSTGIKIGVALDMDSGTVTMYRNNVSQGIMYSGLSGTFFASVSSPNSNITANFGATAMTYSAPGGFNQGLYI